MTAKAFVDTNVLVYARDLAAGTKQAVAHELITTLWRDRCGAISMQVLSEYFVTVTRKLKPGMPETEAWDDMAALSAWSPIALTWPLLESAHELYARHSLSWWDAMIFAAALEADCKILYSEDLDAGMTIGDLQVVNPFRMRV
jgi:predicted nucleic acid-binding protein